MYIFNSLYIYVTFVIICDLMGVVFAKIWYLHHNPWFLAGSIIAFALTGYFFACSLYYENVGIVNVLWTAFSAIIVALVGCIFFKESITLKQMLGIIIIAIGLFVVNKK